MKKMVLLVGLAIFLMVSSCDTMNTGTDMQDELTLKAAQKVLNFRAHLTGDQEVPANDSQATGEAVFQLSKDGMELRYKLIVANIENVRASHIHWALPGVSGGIVVPLFTGPKIAGKVDGILSEGVITASNLTGVLAGKTVMDLVDQIYAGKTYVNVHTDQVPGGEIRGQISGNMPASMN